MRGKMPPTLEQQLRDLTSIRLPGPADVARYFAEFALPLREFLSLTEQLATPKEGEPERHSLQRVAVELLSKEPARAMEILGNAKRQMDVCQLTLGLYLAIGEQANVLNHSTAKAFTDLLGRSSLALARISNDPTKTFQEMRRLAPEAVRLVAELLSTETAADSNALPRPLPRRAPLPSPEPLRSGPDLSAIALPPHFEEPLRAFLSNLQLEAGKAKEFFVKLEGAVDSFLSLTKTLAADEHPQTWGANVLLLRQLAPVQAGGLIESAQSKFRIATISLLGLVAMGKASGFLNNERCSFLENSIQRLGIAVEHLREDPNGALDRVRELAPLIESEALQLLVIPSHKPTAEAPVKGSNIAPAPQPAVTNAPSPSPFDDARPTQNHRPEASRGDGVVDYLRESFGLTGTTAEAVAARKAAGKVSDDLVFTIERTVAHLPRGFLRGLAEHNSTLFPLSQEAGDKLLSECDRIREIYRAREIDPGDVDALLAKDPRLFLKNPEEHKRHADTLRQLRVILGHPTGPMTKELIAAERLLPSAVNATIREERGRKKIKR